MLFDRVDYDNWLDQHALAPRNRFQPLFEAIENGFNAIEESKNTPGRVEVVIADAKKRNDVFFRKLGIDELPPLPKMMS